MTTILKNNRKTKIDRLVIEGYSLHPKIKLILCLVIITGPIIHGIDLWALPIPKLIIDVIRIFGLMAASVIASQHAPIWQKTTETEIQE